MNAHYTSSTLTEEISRLRSALRLARHAMEHAERVLKIKEPTPAEREGARMVMTDGVRKIDQSLERNA